MAEQTIKCKYIFSDSYNPLYANGAQGGISPNGEIIINFFLERNPLPNSQTFEVVKGAIGPEIKSQVQPEDLPNSFVRFIQTGVVLKYETAKEIHRWLGDHLKQLETIIDNHGKNN